MNENKYVFWADEIKLWGLLISTVGISLDPEEVEALNQLTTPNDKEELVSFLCMMKSDADFIPDFFKNDSLLRETTKNDSKFKFENKHEPYLRDLLHSFKKYVLLRYFDRNLQTLIFIDGQQLSFGTFEDATERSYPQLGLEAASLEFG